MRIGVLGNANSWYLHDLVRAAAEITADGQPQEIVPLTFQQLSAVVDPSLPTREEFFSETVLLNRLDAVIVRSMPPGSLEQVVFRMNVLGQLAGRGVVVLNSPRSMEIAIDKYLASARLVEAGFQVPETVVCQSVEDAMAAFERLGGDVVVKPLFGAEGRGITRLEDPALALRAFKMLVGLGAVIYVQRFVPHQGYDLRLFVVGEKVLGMRRRSEDWRTNISLGGKPEPLEVTAELAEMAIRAARSVGTEIAGVDFLPGQDGVLYALEVNAVPGWRALAKILQIDIARRVLQHVNEVSTCADRGRNVCPSQVR